MSYTSTVPFSPDPIVAAVVHSSDGRMARGFEDFVTNGLGLPRVDRLAIPGGPAMLADHDQSYLPAKGVLDELAFLVEAHEVDRVVLVQHAGCAFYGARLDVGPDELEDAQRRDLAAATKVVGERLPGVSIESWALRIDGESISFEPIDLD